MSAWDEIISDAKQMGLTIAIIIVVVLLFLAWSFVTSLFR